MQQQDTLKADYTDLTPEAILGAVESAGYETSGRMLALNSYENRVYQVGIEESTPLVVKFYRANRWSDKQILEEHHFTHELLANELSCVAPLNKPGGTISTHAKEAVTLFRYQDFRYAVFPRQGGYPPNIEELDNLRIMGRAIARIHAQGSVAPFAHRICLSTDRMARESRQLLLQRNFIPADLIDAYASTTEHLLTRLERIDIPTPLRIHGDCHMGNVLWRNDIPHFVDFDDCLMGPAIQDLWMLLSGTRAERSAQLSELVDAYEDFYTFKMSEVALIEPLRTLRIMHHAAWLARRWHDPAFPLAFPWFNTERYWAEHILELREQMAALDEPPLTI